MVLRLRETAIEFIDYKLGDGVNTSFCFDTWWYKTYLASNTRGLSILQSGLHHDTLVHSLISSGSWVLPRPSRRIHHMHPTLDHWLQNFDYPDFDIFKRDSISWDGTHIRKTKPWHIWDVVRFRLPEVWWHKIVFHKLCIERYAHF